MIQESWFWRLPERFRNGGHGAQREAVDGLNRPHELPVVPISTRLDIYRISQLKQEEK